MFLKHPYYKVLSQPNLDIPYFPPYFIFIQFSITYDPHEKSPIQP